MTSLTNVGLGVLVLLLALLVVFYVMWTLATNRFDVRRAVTAAVMIQMFGMTGTLFMVHSPWLMTCNAVGHGLGTYFAVKRAAAHSG